MTIKGLQKLVSQHPGNLTIINQMADGEITRQYISVWGQGVYPADGLPTLDEESILALLDVPTDKRKNWTVKSVRLDQYTWADVLADNAPSDQLAAAISLREHWAEEEKNLKAVRMIHQAAEDIFQRKAPVEP